MDKEELRKKINHLLQYSGYMLTVETEGLTDQILALIPDEQETYNRGFEQGKYEKRERIDNLRDKAIDVIEYLTCNDDFGMSNTPECKLLTTIYTLSHVARGRCLNPHEDWVKELEAMWQTLKGEK